MSGKLKGSLYKVYISPSETKYYSLSKAISEGGFKHDGASDGRKTRHKKKEG